MIRMEDTNDDFYSKKARKKLGYRETGKLYPDEAKKVRVEAGKLKTTAMIKKTRPDAIVKRVRDKKTRKEILRVTVMQG